MTGDPKVLGPLQQAFNASDNPNVQGKLVAAWTLETGNQGTYDMIEYAIRAWTPPAEPSLEQRVAELERAQLHTDQSVGTLLDSTAMLRLTDDTISNDVQSLHERMRVLEESEPTAPAAADLDPNLGPCAEDCSCEMFRPHSPNTPHACECGHNKHFHDDLDPVRVEAAAKAATGSATWHDMQISTRNLYIAECAAIIRAYLNGETR